MRIKKIKRVPIQIRVPIISDKQDCCPYEKPYGYIYLIRNLVNGHMYIGKHHWEKSSLDKRYRGSGVVLSNVYKKYGRENCVISILEWCDSRDSLREIEIYWISVFKTFEFPFHYNRTPGGDNGPGVDKNYYKTNSGKRKRKQQSEFMKNNNPMKNQSSKDKISKALKGTKMSEEARRKMSENHADISGEKNPMYGVHLNGSLNPRARKIVRLDLNMNLISKHNCMKELEYENLDAHYIRQCCKGRRDSFKGYKFMYLEEYEAMTQKDM